jgi:hypothetical protein
LNNIQLQNFFKNSTNKNNQINQTNLQKTKLIFCSKFIWKKIFFFKENNVFKFSEKLIYDRSSVIPKIFSKLTVKIHSGKK